MINGIEVTLSAVPKLNVEPIMTRSIEKNKHPMKSNIAFEDVIMSFSSIHSIFPLIVSI